MLHPFLKIEVSVGFLIGSTCVCAVLVIHSFVFLSLLFLQRVMDPLSSSVSTAPSIDDYFEHNMWNPLLELFFLEQTNGFAASYLVEIDVAKIAFSCHFALDLQCYKEEVPTSAR